MRSIPVITSIAAVLLIGSPVIAQNTATGGGGGAGGGNDPAVQGMLQNMQSEIEKLRGENQKMRGEIDDLHAKTEDNWLTEERAEQIKALVTDVLADADTRASMQDGLQAGWSEHFFLASADGRFKLVMEGLMQVRWNWAYQDLENADNYRYGFENTRTYLTFRGHVFSPDLQYLVRGNFNPNGGTEGLLDAWIRYNMTDHWSVRFGQFKLPFMREELVYEGYQQAVERSLINFVNSAGRSQGVELTYGADYDRISAVYSDGSSSPLGGLNPNRANTPWNAEDTEWAVTARYEHLFAGTWSQFTDFTSPVGDEFGLMLGIAFQGQASESGTPSFFGADTSIYGYTADVSAEFGGANAFASWVHNYVDSPNAIVNFYGLVLQAGFYFTPKWELFGRFEWGWFDVASGTASFEDLILPTIGVTYYIEGQDVKWTTDFGYGINPVENPYVQGNDISGWRRDPTDVDAQMVFRTQFQLLW